MSVMNRKNDFLKISYQHWSGMNQEKEELLIFLVFNANYEIIAEHRCCLASVSQSDPLRTEVGCLRGSVGPFPRGSPSSGLCAVGTELQSWGFLFRPLPSALSWAALPAWGSQAAPWNWQVWASHCALPTNLLGSLLRIFMTLFKWEPLSKSCLAYPRHLPASLCLPGPGPIILLSFLHTACISW